MSSGSLKFQLPGLEVDAKFLNGKLIKGIFCIGDIKYQGTFDDATLLHGTNCLMQISSDIETVSFLGEFLHGEFVKGAKKIDDHVIEEGKYTFSPTYKMPIIVSGSKYYEDHKCIGTFNKYGDLVEGTQYYADSTYEGIFENNMLIEGIVNYNINGKYFTAMYKSIYDMQLSMYLVEKCDVKYNGLLKDIRKKQLVLICCNGSISENIHRFYVKYLDNFDGQTIQKLEKSMFDKLTPCEEACLLFILENIAKYK